MYQTMVSPVAGFLQRMSGLPSLLKSPTPTIFQGLPILATVSCPTTTGPFRYHNRTSPVDSFLSRMSGAPISIEISHPYNIPGGTGRCLEPLLANQGSPIHIPDRHIPGCPICPENVLASVPFEISAPGNFPARAANDAGRGGSREYDRRNEKDPKRDEAALFHEDLEFSLSWYL